MSKNEAYNSLMMTMNKARLYSQSPLAVYTKTPYNYVINSFHSLPHLNMWFALSNSTFDPNNSDYLETILFWSTVPILTLIFILLVLIIYACCLVVFTNNTTTIKLNPNTNRYFSNNLNKKNKKLFKYKFFISVFVFFLSVSLGCIVYGSEKFHYSFREVNTNIRNFSNYFAQIGTQAKQAKELINNQINSTLGKYEKDLKAAVDSNRHRSSQVLNELSNVKRALNESFNALDGLNQLEKEKNAYVTMMNQVDLVEQTRWAIMIGVVTINMLLITLLIIGLIRNSKGSLCFFAFAGVLSLISIWVLNALYLGITVFVSDYCTSPDQYILTVAEKNQMKYLVQYYTTCSVSQIGNTKINKQQLQSYTPFKLDLNKVESKLRTANTLYSDNLIPMSRSLLNEQQIGSYNFQESISIIEKLIDKIRSSIRCDQTSHNYRQAVNALCTNSILGLAFVVLAGLVFGFIMPILICVIPQMWRRMHTKDLYDYHTNNTTNGHLLNEETHPFIASNTGTAQIRTNISAARQFNESPSFQRLAVNSSSTNSNITSNTLNRNRYNTTSRSNYAATSNIGSNLNHYSQTLKMTNRLHNDYMLHNSADPYSVINSHQNTNSSMGFPPAPNQTNPNSNVFQSYYTQTQTTAQGLYH
ncbi:unnamed protein product [Brachionus calyciflorus]|uniref:Protein tweety homolog n=1 Tax=Brachionus calyciflorus TaxID=104777 RepID=A0A813P120_9BILA|nr:unnamed protein product [Brachionus calyciflorus]